MFCMSGPAGRPDWSLAVTQRARAFSLLRRVRPDGRLYVAWYDRSTGQLYLVVQNEEGFQSAEVVAGWESSEI